MQMDINKTSIGFNSKTYNDVKKIYGDEGYADAVISNVAEHLLKFPNETEWAQLSHSLNARPITQKQCQTTLNLIDQVLTIVIVEPKVNYHAESDSNLVCWERELDITSNSLYAYFNEHQVTALKQSFRSTIPLLTITNTAHRALKRYKDESGRPKYVNPLIKSNKSASNEPPIKYEWPNFGPAIQIDYEYLRTPPHERQKLLEKRNNENRDQSRLKKESECCSCYIL